ncbi:hypothetical protein [Vibrio sp. MA40-2]|uniref:hypothetical protein n=1 Tax=Vibrio sp. MA40-2 TaxID=3391828 RepID=UPI0039A5D87D
MLDNFKKNLRGHLTGITVGFWMTTILVAMNNPLDFYGTWICVAIAATLTTGLIVTHKKPLTNNK